MAVRLAVTYTGAVLNYDALPIATDRPMGGRIVSLAIFPGRELVLMLLGEYLPNAPSLTLGARLSTSYPLRPVGGGATPKAPLSLLGSSRGYGCVSSRVT